MRRASPCAPPWGQEWHDESTDTADLNDPMSFKSLLGYVWASPATAIGLLCVTAAVCGGAKLRRVDGVLEIAGGRLLGAVRRIPRFGFVAITLGHVVMGVDDGCLAEARAHEHVHVRQYERWGVLFFPLYAASSLVQIACGRDPYRDNAFEREARAGG